MTTTLTGKEMAAIENILMEQLEIAREQITPEARIKEDLGADSLDIVEIIMKAEDAFSIAILDDIAEQVQTVEDLQTTLAKLLNR